MKQLLNEVLNVLDRQYCTKAGKTYTIIYIDKKTSSEIPYEERERLKQYGAEYLPYNKWLKSNRYLPQTWGWVLWDGNDNSKILSAIKRFKMDNDVTLNLKKALNDAVAAAQEVSLLELKTKADAQAKQTIADFEKMVNQGLGNPETQAFMNAYLDYKEELKKHYTRGLSPSNTIIMFMTTGGKATRVVSKGQWKKEGWIPKPDAKPICLIGMGFKKSESYTESEKNNIISNVLAKKGVKSVSQLEHSVQWELDKKIKEGKPDYSSRYFYAYIAYDKADVMEDPSRDPQTIERPPEKTKEMDNWWDHCTRDEKDERLTNALIEFARSNECGNIVVNADNTQEGLGGARGNATSSGVLNLIDDENVRFPTAVHELLHSLRHWDVASTNNPDLRKYYYRNDDREIREQEAELCTLFVIRHFDYNLQPHYNYLKDWKIGENCHKVFDQIAKVADFIEYGVEKYSENNENNEEEQWKQEEM
jgi:hypothetical protein